MGGRKSDTKAKPNAAMSEKISQAVAANAATKKAKLEHWRTNYTPRWTFDAWETGAADGKKGDS